MTTPTTNSFLAALQDLRGGETLNDLHVELMKLVGDVRSLGKAGTLQLTIKLAPQGTATLVVTDEIKATPPKPEKEFTVLYADDANRLSRRDPRQPKLPEMQSPSDVRQFSRPIAVGDDVDRETGEVKE